MATNRVGPQRRSPIQSQIPETKQALTKKSRWLRRVACVISLAVLDALTLMIALGVALIIDTQAYTHTFANAQWFRFHQSGLVRLGSVWMLLLVFVAAEGLYTKRRTLWCEMGHLIKAIGMGLVVIWSVGSLSTTPPVISHFGVALASALLALGFPLTRYWTKRLLFVSGPWRKRLLILGAADTAALALSGLCNDPILGYEPVGFLDDDPDKIGKTLAAGRRELRVLGPVSAASYWIGKTEADDILIAMPGLREDKLLALIFKLQPHCESLLVVPQLWALSMMNLEVDGFFRERILLLKLSNNLAKPWNMWLKRGCDLILGCLLLAVSLPLYLIFAILIKIDSAGPVIFAQTRLGLRDSLFSCLKFRTMYQDGESKLNRYLEANPEAERELVTYAKLREFDPRVTRIGRLLRRWSMDELPQLINVLRGDMSLVGPRPYLPKERDEIEEHLPIILSARPGLSGLWQVNGRNHLTFQTRVQLEEWYVRHWSIWLDCIVLLKTLGAVFSSAPDAEPCSWAPEKHSP